MYKVHAITKEKFKVNRDQWVLFEVLIGVRRFPRRGNAHNVVLNMITMVIIMIMMMMMMSMIMTLMIMMRRSIRRRKMVVMILIMITITVMNSKTQTLHESLRPK